jgi:hypothetical protein
MNIPLPKGVTPEMPADWQTLMQLQPGQLAPPISSCSVPLATPAEMTVNAFWQMMALSGTIWLTLAMSAVSFPFEAAMAPFTQPDR